MIYPKEREEITRREEAIKELVEALWLVKEWNAKRGFIIPHRVTVPISAALQRWEECK